MIASPSSDQASSGDSRPTAGTSGGKSQLAIVAWQALPAIFKDSGQNIGGAETGLWTLARTLAAQAEISVAIAVSAGRDGYARQVNGVELWIHVDRFAKARRFVSDHIDVSPRFRLKRFHPSLLFWVPWLLLTRPLRQRDPQPMAADPRLLPRSPEVWAAFGVTADTARTVATAIKQGKRSIVFIQSNADLEERLAAGESFVSRWGDPSDDRLYAIRNASLIVCQTRHQLESLKHHFGRDGELIRNPIDVDTWRLPKRPNERYALWIGRYDSFHKQPLIMIRAAHQCPAIRFKMVINPGDREIEQEVRRMRPPNVEIISHVPFGEMPGLFSGASVFISTGAKNAEGFPNVLLQAAASHTPIVSMHDFDSFLKVSGAGLDCGGDPDRLAGNILSQWENPTIDWQSVDRYLATNHDPTHAARRVAELVNQAVQTKITEPS